MGIIRRAMRTLLPIGILLELEKEEIGSNLVNPVNPVYQYVCMMF